MGKKKDIRKAEKKAAKRIAKQQRLDREASDEALLEQAMAAFDAEHHLDIGTPEDDRVVYHSTPKKVQEGPSDVERIVTQVVKEHFGKDPRIDLSVSMSLLVSTLHQIGNDPEAYDLIIETLQDIREGGDGGAYKKDI